MTFQPHLPLIIELPRKSGRFVRGVSYSPRTQIKRGQHLSTATEFKPGTKAHNRLPVGSVTIRKRNGGQRAFVKIAEPSVWRERAHLVWEAHHGKSVPKGKVIHHKDRDMLNDTPSNLEALTRAEHAKAHESDVKEAGFGGEIARMRATEARRKG